MKALLWILLSAAASFAAEPERFSTTLSVNLRCQDASLKYQILTAFGAQIRKLGDVVIINPKDDVPDYDIDIIALVTSNNEQPRTGYGMTIVIRRRVERYVNTLLDTVRDRRPAERDEGQTVAAYLTLLALGTEIVDQRLIVGPIDSIEAEARAVIAELDVKTFEPDRRAWRQSHKR